MKQLFLLLFCFAYTFSTAQNSAPVSYYGDDNFLSMGFQTGYNSLNINPANLSAVDGKKIELGIINFNLLFHTDGITRGDLIDLFQTEEPINTEVRNLLVNAVSKEEGISADIDVDWLYASLKLGKGGSFSAGISEEISSNFFLNDTLANILAFGADSTQFFTDPNNLIFTANSIDGSNVLYSHIRSLNLGYSRKLMTIGTEDEPIDIHAGIGYKKLWGIGYFNVNAANGTVGGNSAFSELYDVDYKFFDYVFGTDSKVFDNVGTGSAYSVGAHLNFNDKLNIGASVLDIGKITWEGELFAPLNPTSLELDSLLNGLDDLNINDQLEELYGLFDFRDAESFETKLNSKFKIGGSFEASKNFRVGVDATFPLKEEALDREKSVFSIGAAINLVPKVLSIDGGISSSQQYGTRIPLGISLNFLGVAQISLATADITTLLSDNTDPLSNISLGTLKVNFN